MGSSLYRTAALLIKGVDNNNYIVQSQKYCAASKISKNNSVVISSRFSRTQSET